MKHFICPKCERDFHRARLLRWHLKKHCGGIIPANPKVIDEDQTTESPTSPGVSIDFGPSTDVLTARQDILAEIQDRASSLRQMLEDSNTSKAPVKTQIPRRKEAIFPPPVPRYQPPRPTRQEVDRVRKALFTE